MKTYILILSFLLCTNTVWNYTLADQGILAENLTGIRYSMLYKSYAVLTNFPENEELTPSNRRLQVFDSETGDLKWSTEVVPGFKQNLFVADDGMHIIWLYNGRRRNFYGTGVLSQQSREEIENMIVVQFYRQKKFLKSYTVKELGLTAEDVQIYWLRFSTFRYDGPDVKLFQHIRANLNHRNPLVLDEVMRLIGMNGNVWYFDITSGQILEKKPEIFMDYPVPSIAPRRDFFGPYEKNERE